MTRTLDYRPEHGLYLWHYGDALDGVQYIFRFNNGFGASVIKHMGSYGHQDDKWELAVIKFEGEREWDLVYYTDITNDIEGHLTDEDVNNLLDRIKNLDRFGKETTEDETEQD